MKTGMRTGIRMVATTMAAMAPWVFAHGATEMECRADATPYGGSIIKVALVRSANGRLQALTDGKVIVADVREERHVVRHGALERNAMNPAEQLLEMMRQLSKLPRLPSGQALPPSPIDTGRVAVMTMYALEPGKFGQGWLIKPVDVQGHPMGTFVTAGLGFALPCR